MDADGVEELAEDIRRTASNTARRNRWFHPDGWGVTASEGCVYVIGPERFGGNLSLTSWDLEPVARIVAEAIVTGEVEECRRRLSGQPQKRSETGPKRKRAFKPKTHQGGNGET